MVLQKLISYTWASASSSSQSEQRGDPSIVYLDGVTPPTSRISLHIPLPDVSMMINNNANNIINMMNNSTGQMPVTKRSPASSPQQPRPPLQTIDEDDSETRIEVQLVDNSCEGSLGTPSKLSISEEFDEIEDYDEEEEENDVEVDLDLDDEDHGFPNSGSLRDRRQRRRRSATGDSVSRKTSMESVSSTDSTMSDMSTSSDASSYCCSMPPNGGTTNNQSHIIKLQSVNPEATNNNSLPHEISHEELELLKKLEEQNRLIETDAKALNSLAGTQTGHSRRSSDTSQISITSGSSGQDTLKADDNAEEDLWTFWGKLINEWDICYRKKAPQIKELVRRGIPHHFRGIAWQLLCGAHESKDKPKYADYIRTQSACEKVIRRDIARTYPEHEFFKKKDGFGQEALFNVMKAYSILDREVGYCQGSAFIVGLLLMQMPEEETFAVLVKIMQEYRMREMFKPSMAELGLCMYQLDMLVQEHIPDLYGHFQSQAIHTNLYASSWFLTLFTTSLPISLACRVMDCFLAEGIEVIFRLALSLLLIGKNELLVQDIEGVIRYFQKEMPAKFEADPEVVIGLAFNLKINQKKMKKMEKEYMTMKTKEKEDEIELRRLRTENRLLRQRVDLLEQESSDLADRLIQGQVTRAEIEEQSFAMKRELAAIKQHDLDTNQQLEEAKDRIRRLSEMVESQSLSTDSQSADSKSQQDEASQEFLKQKEDMIHCLQEELIKVRLREAENEETIRKLGEKISELEDEKKKLRESVPENHVACLQEELAAAKLREAEANLALKELKAKVAELNTMWIKHLKRSEAAKLESVEAAPSTPKKLFGSLLEGKSEAARLEEELMTVRLTEVECQAELKDQRLKVMELETQNQVIANQLKRQHDELSNLREFLEGKSQSELKLQMQVREAQRKYADLESRMKEDLMMARIREAESSQRVAELTQKISALEYKNQEKMTEGDIATTMDQSYKVRELQDKIAHLRAQVTRLSLMNANLSKSLSLHNLATSFSSASSSEHSSPSVTPKQIMSPANSSLMLQFS